MTRKHVKHEWYTLQCARIGPNFVHQRRTGFWPACNLNPHHSRGRKHLHLCTYLPFPVLISLQQGTHEISASPEQSKLCWFFCKKNVEGGKNPKLPSEIKQSTAPCFPTASEQLIGSCASNQEVNLIGWWLSATQRASRASGLKRAPSSTSAKWMRHEPQKHWANSTSRAAPNGFKSPQSIDCPVKGPNDLNFMAVWSALSCQVFIYSGCFTKRGQNEDSDT